MVSITLVPVSCTGTATPPDLSKSNQKYLASTPLVSLPFHLTSPATLSGLLGWCPRWSCCELASSSIMWCQSSWHWPQRTCAVHVWVLSVLTGRKLRLYPPMTRGHSSGRKHPAVGTQPWDRQSTDSSGPFVKIKIFFAFFGHLSCCNAIYMLMCLSNKSTVWYLLFIKH